ncbi:MAG TPA: flagellar motor protein [Candidatus Macondimonas sp.]|nr:flagellar motor protein [Candidatus Macondimonas sp.]
MDIFSLLGLLLAAVAVIGGSILKGSGVAALLNPAAFVIVGVGTLASIFLHTPMPVFLHAMKLLRLVFTPPRVDLVQMIEKIVSWSQIARKDGLLGLEAVIEQEPGEFERKGMQLLVDGTGPEAIRQILEVDLFAKEHRDLQGAKVFESMGIYSPTLGIIGAVLGLMSVMQHLDDPSHLGTGIAAAFVATIYGIGFANLLFLPISAKLKAVIQEQVRAKEVLIEGVLAIAHGENPRNIETKLKGYLHH